MLLVKIRNVHFSISFSAALTALHCVAKTNLFDSLFHIYLDKFCLYSIFTTRWLILTILKEKNYYKCLECKKKRFSYTAVHVQCVICNLTAVTQQLLLFPFFCFIF